YDEITLENKTFFVENINFLKSNFAIKFEYKNKIYNLFFYFAEEVISLNIKNKTIKIWEYGEPKQKFKKYKTWFPKIVKSIESKKEKIWWIFVQEKQLSDKIRENFENVPDNMRVFCYKDLNKRIKDLL
ncbi:hypothetical protein C4M81_03365, partial [Mycoplasmopsis pullorum]